MLRVKHVINGLALARGARASFGSTQSQGPVVLQEHLLVAADQDVDVAVRSVEVLRVLDQEEDFIVYLGGFG